MKVAGADSEAAPVALGGLSAVLGPPLRVVETYLAVSLREIHANDVAAVGFVFDFGQNFAGMARLSLPAGHALPAGTELRIEHAEIVAGPFIDTGGMCKLCPTCGACAPVSPDEAGGDVEADLRGNNNCALAGSANGAICDTYCSTTKRTADQQKPLRDEPCFPHQSAKTGAHETPNRFIGDFNCANQTNIYTVGAGNKAEVYTPKFAASGVRYAQITGLPAGVRPALSWMTGLKVNSNVASAGRLRLPVVSGKGSGTPDVLNKIHAMTLASQSSNLWSV